MAYRSGLFNSVNGDRKYQAAHFAEYFATFIGNGVFPNPSNGLQVYAKENMTVTVKAGKAWINGYYFVNDSDCDLTLAISDGVLNRIDRIVLRFDTSTRQIVPSVRKGVFSASPTAPAIQRDADGYEISLAQITVTKGTLAINQGAILDERLNNNVCGIVHGIVDQVDTTTIFNQYRAWFNEITNGTETEIETWKEDQYQSFADWFATIQGILEGDVAANLAARITTLGQQFAAHQADLTHVHWIGTATGTNALTATYEAIPTLKNGLGIAFLNTISSTSATTLNINNLGAIPILKANGNPVTNLKTNGIYTLRYANRNFIVQGEGGEYGTATPEDVAEGKTFGTENGLVNGTLKKIIAVAGNNTVLFQDSTEKSIDATTTYTKLIDLKWVGQSGSLRIKFSGKQGYSGYHSNFQIYKNNVAEGSEKQSPNSYINFVQDININTNDIISIYGKNATPAAGKIYVKDIIVSVESNPFIEVIGGI